MPWAAVALSFGPAAHVPSVAGARAPESRRSDARAAGGATAAAVSLVDGGRARGPRRGRESARAPRGAAASAVSLPGGRPKRLPAPGHLAELGLDRARAEGADVDARPAQLLGEPLGEREHERLGRAVDRHVRRRLEGRGRGDVQDDALARGAQVGQERVGEEDERLAVQADHRRAAGPGRARSKRPYAPKPALFTSQAGAAELARGGRRSAPARSVVGDVDGERVDPAWPRRARLVGERTGAARCGARPPAPGGRGAQSSRASASADAGRGAGHDGELGACGAARGGMAVRGSEARERPGGRVARRPASVQPPGARSGAEAATSAGSRAGARARYGRAVLPPSPGTSATAGERQPPTRDGRTPRPSVTVRRPRHAPGELRRQPRLESLVHRRPDRPSPGMAQPSCPGPCAAHAHAAAVHHRPRSGASMPDVRAPGRREAALEARRGRGPRGRASPGERSFVTAPPSRGRAPASWARASSARWMA